MYGLKNFPHFMILLFLVTACKSSDEKIRPEMGPITESVYASVTVLPCDMYYANVPVGGIVEELLVLEGQEVQNGEALLKIDSRSPWLNAESARLNFDHARKNIEGSRSPLRNLESKVKLASLQVSIDSVNYERQVRLYQKGIGSKAQLEARELAFRSSYYELRTFENQLAQMQQEYQVQLRQAENTYRSSQKMANDYTLRSTIDGIVYKLTKEAGELVSPQEPVALLGSKDSFLLEMRVDEVDISMVAAGQHVLINLDAYEDKIIEGRVTRIFPTMDLRSQTFKVEAEFLQLPGKLYPMLTGEANIIVNSRDEALSIPYEYLVNEGQVRTEDGLVDVSTGIRNFERVEITGGLDSLTVIYKPKE